MKRKIEDSFATMLLSDVNAAFKRRNVSDTQMSRRDVVRTTYAAIEGYAWIFRETIVDAARNTYGLEAEEELALTESVTTVSDTGKTSTQTRYLPLRSMIGLIARIADRINDDETIDFSRSEWEALSRVSGLRNRITHPRSSDDLQLSGEEVDQAVETMFWLLEQFTTSMARSVTTRKRYLGDLQDVFAKLRAGDPETTELYRKIAESD